MLGRITGKECGHWIEDGWVRPKIPFGVWKIITEKKKFFCRRCRKNVKVTAEEIE